MATKITVTTVEGVAVQFGDFASKFIALHPKTGVIVALIVGAVIGHIL